MYIAEKRVYRNKLAIATLYKAPPVGKPVYFKGEKPLDCRILLYHEFTEKPPLEANYGEISTPARFEENVKKVLALGYEFISLESLLEYDGGILALPEKSVILTFDDGYESNYTLIYPILKKYNIPATIFVNVSRMGLEGKLTWEQMREMEQSGLVNIQSHSWTHVDLTQLTTEELNTAVSDSFEKIEAELGKRKYRQLAYPYGKHDAHTIKVVSAHEVKIQLTTIWKSLDMAHLDFTALPRFNVSYTADIERILKQK